MQWTCMDFHQYDFPCGYCNVLCLYMCSGCHQLTHPLTDERQSHLSTMISLMISNTHMWTLHSCNGHVWSFTGMTSRVVIVMCCFCTCVAHVINLPIHSLMNGSHIYRLWFHCSLHIHICKRCTHAVHMYDYPSGYCSRAAHVINLRIHSLMNGSQCYRLQFHWSLFRLIWWCDGYTANTSHFTSVNNAHVESVMDCLYSGVLTYIKKIFHTDGFLFIFSGQLQRTHGIFLLLG